MQPLMAHSLVKLLPVRCLGCRTHARWNLHAGQVVEVTQLVRSRSGEMLVSFFPPWQPQEVWLASPTLLAQVPGFDPEPSWTSIEQTTGWAPPRRKHNHLETLVYHVFHLFAPWVAL